MFLVRKTWFLGLKKKSLNIDQKERYEENYLTGNLNSGELAPAFHYGLLGSEFISHKCVHRNKIKYVKTHIY